MAGEGTDRTVAQRADEKGAPRIYKEHPKVNKGWQPNGDKAQDFNHCRKKLGSRCLSRFKGGKVYLGS